MLRVRQFEKYLSEINPHATPVRQALHNYIKNFHELDEPLSVELFNQFFDLALDDPHWARLRGPLSHEVQALIKNFTSFYQTPFSTVEIKYPEHRQLIEIEQASDFEAVVQSYAQRLCEPADHLKVINDQSKRFLVLLLKADSTLQVRSVQKKFMLRSGQLEPLIPQLMLQYNAKLELDESFVHHIEVSPQMICQFTVQDQKLSGVISRGYVFQKFQTFTSAALHEIPRLFWALKRIEQFFISRETDPFYTEITRQLEKMSQVPRLTSTEAQQVVPVLLGQAEAALEQIYRDDKKLADLIKEVKKNANSKSSESCLKISPKPQFDLTN